MMPKTRCTDLNQILNRNLKYFEHKSERNLCEIYKILRSPFGIRFRTYLKSSSQKIRLCLDLEQKSDRFQTQIWSKYERSLVDFRSNPMCIFGRARMQFNSSWGDAAEGTLHRFESDFEQKSEIFRTQIWTKSVRNLQDFAPSILNQISFRFEREIC